MNKKAQQLYTIGALAIALILWIMYDIDLFILILMTLGLLGLIPKLKNFKNNSSADMDTTTTMESIKSGTRKTVLYGLGILVVVIFVMRMVVVIGAGEIGVQVFWGKVAPEPLYSGIHIINPLAHVITFDARTRQYYMGIAADNASQNDVDDPIRVLTAEGLSIDLDISTLYRVQPERITEIYKNVGVGYEELIIRPEIRSIIRDTIAHYSAKDIYSEKRQEIVTTITDSLHKKLEARGILLEDVLLRNVTLPPDLVLAIQEKLRTEQESQKYDFVLEKEVKEAERKRIEAEGQRAYQRIISESLSKEFLYYQYINQLKDRQGTIYVPTNPATGLPQFNGI